MKYSETFKEKFSTGGGFGAWLGILFTAGFTPLPFKLLTISSGIIHFNLITFIFICIVTRGLRFFLVAYLTYKFGQKIGPFLDKQGAKWSIIIAGIIILSSNSHVLLVSKIKMTKQINKKFLVSVLVFTSLVLVSAFIIEHQLGHKPCKLCLYERIPYFLSILLII